MQGKCSYLLLLPHEFLESSEVEFASIGSPDLFVETIEFRTRLDELDKGPEVIEI